MHAPVKGCYRFLTLIAIIFFARVSTAWAQADCTQYMSFGIYDTNDVLSDVSKFQQFQSLIKQNNFSSYQEATESLTTAGFSSADIDGILSLDFSGHDSKTQWQQWQSAFLQSQFSQIQDNDQYVSKVRTVSKEITQIVKTCLRTSQEGLFAWIEPAKDNKSFTFTARYVHWGAHTSTKISSLDFEPASIKATCGNGGLHLFSPGRKLNGGGSSIACTRQPTQTVIVTLNTDDGTKRPKWDAYEPPAPPVTFSVTPPSIAPGQTATLAWNVRDATAVNIIPTGGTVSQAGALVVNPTSDTTYVLTAVGPGGSSQSTVKLSVSTPPAPTAASTPAAISCLQGGNSDAPFPGQRYYIVTNDGRLLFRNGVSTDPNLGLGADDGKAWTVVQTGTDILIECPGLPGCYLLGQAPHPLPPTPVPPSWTLKPIKAGGFDVYEMQYVNGLYFDYAIGNDFPVLGPEAPGLAWRFCKK